MTADVYRLSLAPRNRITHPRGIEGGQETTKDTPKRVYFLQTARERSE